jgi:mRNA-degrading endonuclease RelE of RelBE toxin-antitoxin system
MPYSVTITPQAKAQLLSLTARERRIVEDGIAARLLDQPKSPSRAIKPLRPNPLAGYELRLGDLRAFYNVDEENVEVVIVVVGRKVGNALVVGGEEFHGHEGDSSE